MPMKCWTGHTLAQTLLTILLTTKLVCNSWIFSEVGCMSRYLYSVHMSRNFRKRSFGYVLPAEIQISLRIHAVWSVFVDRMKKLSLCAHSRFWADCANVQADLNLRRLYMSGGTFSDIVVQHVQNLNGTMHTYKGNDMGIFICLPFHFGDTFKRERYALSCFQLFHVQKDTKRYKFFQVDPFTF